VPRENRSTGIENIVGLATARVNVFYELGAIQSGIDCRAGRGDCSTHRRRKDEAGEWRRANKLAFASPLPPLPRADKPIVSDPRVVFQLLALPAK